MTKRSGHGDGRAGGGSGSDRPRVMTVYDRLEDARRRRRELLSQTAPEDVKPAARTSAPVREIRPERPAMPPKTKPAPAPPPPRAEEITDWEAPEPARRQRRRIGWLLPAVLLTAFWIWALPPLNETPQETPAADVPSAAEPSTKLETEPAPANAIRAQTAGPVMSPVRLSDTPPVAPQGETAVARAVPPGLAALAPDLAPPVAATPETDVPPVALPVAASPRPRLRPVPDAPPAPDDVTLVLHVSDGASDIDAAAAAAVLGAAGIAIDERRTSPLSISRTNIRYFHVEDAAFAALVAEAIGGQLRDFTSFRPSPPPGIVEIWLAGGA